MSPRDGRWSAYPSRYEHDRILRVSIWFRVALQQHEGRSWKGLQRSLDGIPRRNKVIVNGIHQIGRMAAWQHPRNIQLSSFFKTLARPQQRCGIFWMRVFLDTVQCGECAIIWTRLIRTKKSYWLEQTYSPFPEGHLIGASRLLDIKLW